MIEKNVAECLLKNREILLQYMIILHASNTALQDLTILQHTFGTFFSIIKHHSRYIKVPKSACRFAIFN